MSDCSLEFSCGAYTALDTSIVDLDGPISENLDEATEEVDDEGTCK